MHWSFRVRWPVDPKSADWWHCAASTRDRNAVDAHVWAQHFWDQNRAVRLLIVFHDGDPCAANGEPRAIQGVNEVALAAFRFETNAGAARLERFAVGTGRNLHEFAGRRNPSFDVICFRGSEAQIAGTQLHHAIMNAELLENRFRVA